MDAEEEQAIIPFASGLGCGLAVLVGLVVIMIVWWALTGHLPLVDLIGL